MRKHKKTAIAVVAAFAMLILILDSKTALDGANQGIQICIRTLIPSLFPFFILSSLITSGFSGIPLNILRPICKCCGIPKGAECLFLTGILGGYPVGAKAVGDARRNNSISRRDAEQILALCNNAGPAFIFGIMGSVFHSFWIPAVIWVIQILSTVVAGVLTGKKTPAECKIQYTDSFSWSKVMENSLKAIGSVCGWVILFRILILNLERWFMFAVSSESRVLVTGLLELANGCLALSEINNISLRFIFANAMLAFGGICVTMQTISVVGDLSIGKQYFLHKGLHCLISILTAIVVQGVIFQNHNTILFSVIATVLVSAVIITIIYKQTKKDVAFQKYM